MCSCVCLCVCVHVCVCVYIIYYFLYFTVVIHGRVALPNLDVLSLPNESSSRELYAMFPQRDIPRVSIPAKFISDRLRNTSSDNVSYAYAMFGDFAQFTPCEKCG